MAEIGKTTRITNKAAVNILKGLARAKGSLADIPLGVTKLDPRTEKKRALDPNPGLDTTLTRLLYEMRGKTVDMEDQQE
jgi:hypothetical protein